MRGVVSLAAALAIPLTIAVRFRIPLVVWGENSAFEYGGSAEESTRFLRQSVEIFEASDELQRDPLLLGWAATPHLCR